MKKSFYPVFYLLSWTWGILSTLPGALLALILLCLGEKPHRLGPLIYFRVGKRWGGMEFGMFFIRDDTSSDHVSYHEAGHALQTIVLGPLMLPIVSLPSTVRYHYRNFLKKFCKEKAKKMPPYDSIWFEGQASRLGYRYFKKDTKIEDTALSSDAVTASLNTETASSAPLPEETAENCRGESDSQNSKAENPSA